MVLCIEAVHNLGWMHRDIKPDNFLVGADGHLKISDFGLAFDGKLDHCQSYYASKRQQLLDKFGIHVNGDAQDVAEEHDAPLTGLQHDCGPCLGPIEKQAEDNSLESFQNLRKHARSIVGTHQYMAPEIVLGLPYDGRCDWWSLGVLVYEMLYGHTPFYDEDRQRTKQNIVAYQQALEFPIALRLGRAGTEDPLTYATPSTAAVNFMRCLLAQRDQRLGSSAYQYPDLDNQRHDSGVYLKEAKHVKTFDADEVKQHPWFAPVPWSVMHERRPPWIPSIQPGQSVTKYFEDEPEILADDGWVQKRSRDKVLRDPELGPCALEERRRTAFFGYTYRRLTTDMKIPVFQRPRANAVSARDVWACNAP